MEDEIKKKFDDHESRISFLENLLKTKPAIVEKEISIKEFIISKKPKSNVQKTLTIGYFLEKYSDNSTFTVKEIEDGYQSAKEKISNNINLDIIANIKQGHMMEAKEKNESLKAWCLTNTGVSFVENNFKKE